VVVLDILGRLQEIRTQAAAIGVVIQCQDQVVVVVVQLAAVMVQQTPVVVVAVAAGLQDRHMQGLVAPEARV
jgi:hypothetical protein